MVNVSPESRTSISFSVIPGNSAVNLNALSSSVISTTGAAISNVLSKWALETGAHPRKEASRSNNRSISARNAYQIPGACAGGTSAGTGWVIGMEVFGMQASPSYSVEAHEKLFISRPASCCFDAAQSPGGSLSGYSPRPARLAWHGAHTQNSCRRAKPPRREGPSVVSLSDQ